ncbi:hypothetical protein PV328_000998 [Microctonus aethiopoides]|uniref:Uncharacterized protein n=1 Tax=Microctonus aethiopoides TaxID=144406 RepID=A0AA39FWS0_9HYME|nr:hypothetical protein PV328_000998 [Microctonus aethiopoides]
MYNDAGEIGRLWLEFPSITTGEKIRKKVAASIQRQNLSRLAVPIERRTCSIPLVPNKTVVISFVYVPNFDLIAKFKRNIRAGGVAIYHNSNVSTHIITPQIDITTKQNQSLSVVHISNVGKMCVCHSTFADGQMIHSDAGNNRYNSHKSRSSSASRLTIAKEE